jgi:hypothetical protein
LGKFDFNRRKSPQVTELKKVQGEIEIANLCLAPPRQKNCEKKWTGKHITWPWKCRTLNCRAFRRLQSSRIPKNIYAGFVHAITMMRYGDPFDKFQTKALQRQVGKSTVLETPKEALNITMHLKN